MTASARDIIFNHSERVAPLGLIAIPGSEELGKKVNDYLVTWSREAGYDYDNFLIENECPRFSSGDVTQPLCPAVIKAMHKAVDEMAEQASFRGYGPEREDKH